MAESLVIANGQVTQVNVVQASLELGKIMLCLKQIINRPTTIGNC